ncbi:hypothetical protein CKK33_08475 [Mucilaginibacter sp. MD40]|uniref:hypothetical protein n=1 Tax=Mucilaginibacter sp. MD40 TaxID=2029590 RepID=UPI000BACA7C5|nr:hypothetical protein [Mucilaginibacter sp. MD40]PAW93525.1 hypothetical protein CKK33_08475 [Mucilaginibacter sp. MD40]
MKTKLLLLFMGLSMAFLGCKKDKAPVDKLADIKKQIMGTWQVQSVTVTYYDASGKIVKTDNQDGNNGEVYQFVNETTLKQVGEFNDSYAYNLTNVNNKIMLNVSNNSFEVNFSGNNSMSWSEQETYPDGGSYTSSTRVIQLIRK